MKIVPLPPRRGASAGAPACPPGRLLAGETLHEERWRPTLSRPGGPIVFLLWHDALLPLLWHIGAAGVAIVVSEAQDGQYLSEFARGIGYREAGARAPEGASGR